MSIYMKSKKHLHAASIQHCILTANIRIAGILPHIDGLTGAGIVLVTAHPDRHFDAAAAGHGTVLDPIGPHTGLL